MSRINKCDAGAATLTPLGQNEDTGKGPRMAIVDDIRTEAPIEYPKIKTLYRRDPDTHKVLSGEFTLPVFEYLRDCLWYAYEKIDGTNIRVHWDGEKVCFYGRTSRAQLSTRLLITLQGLFPPERFGGYDPLCLYGEGYGAGIQKAGGKYIFGSNSFLLFDVRCGGWWLERADVTDVAAHLGIGEVPLICTGTSGHAAGKVFDGFESIESETSLQAEGLVMRPAQQLFTRAGERIIAKLKTKDFDKG